MENTFPCGHIDLDDCEDNVCASVNEVMIPHNAAKVKRCQCVVCGEWFDNFEYLQIHVGWH